MSQGHMVSPKKDTPQNRSHRPFSSSYPDPWWSSLYHHSCWRAHKSVLQLYKRKDFQHIMYSFSSVIFLVLHCPPRISNRDQVKHYNLKRDVLRATDAQPVKHQLCKPDSWAWPGTLPSEKLDVVSRTGNPSTPTGDRAVRWDSLLEAWGQPRLESTVQSRNKNESSEVKVRDTSWHFLCPPQA